LEAASATHLPLDIPIEEERRKDYDPRHFYPVKLGEIFHDKYEVVVKVGFGGGSTVWLARNLQRYVFSLLSLEILLSYSNLVSRRDMLF
jgi:serine/threonine-protein kinase SRPK3